MKMNQPLVTEADVLSAEHSQLPSSRSEYLTQPAPILSGYGSIQQPDVPSQNYGWFKNFRKNMPLFTSQAAAFMIFMSGGMSLLVSVGFGPLIEYGTHKQFCWFIAVIIGACLSAWSVHKIPKLTLNLFASVLVITNGIIYIACEPTSKWITSARYCDGIAFGLTIIPAILSGSEQCVNKYRRLVLSVEHVGLIAGAVVITIFTDTWKTDKDTNRLHGITAIAYGVLALTFTVFFTIESPIFHLRKNNETEAVSALRRLQKPGTVTNETIAALNENKSLLDEDRARETAENISNSLIPLFKITIFRTLVSLSFSLPIIWGYLLVSSLNAMLSDPNIFIFVLMRLIGVWCSFLTFGQKIFTALSQLIGSLLLVAVATTFSNISDITEDGLHAVVAFMLIHQLLSGIVAPASTCYLGEAFSVSVKPYFILISLIFENTILIFVCATAKFDSTSNFAYVLAALQFTCSLAFYFVIPDTKQKTLREALEMFKKTINVNLGNF